MRHLKKLNCSTNLKYIYEKPYEDDVIEFLIELYSQFKQKYSSNFIHNFYYPQSIDSKKLNKFKSKFDSVKDFVRFEEECTFNIRNSWYVILTEEELKTYNSLNNRSFYILKELSEQSLTKAFLDFYSKASLLTQINSRGNKQ